MPIVRLLFECITRRRAPFSPYYNQLDRFQPLPQLRIIFESNAKQGIAILFHEPFGPRLPWFEDQPRFHITAPETIAHYLSRDTKNIIFRFARNEKSCRREAL
jgi:hypothetical protein